MNEPHPDENTFLHETTEIPVEHSVQGRGGRPWFSGQSDRGKVRPNNEDQFCLDAERNLFIVADGMGGHAAGEVASLIAVETLHQVLSQVIDAGSSNLEDEIAEALRRTNTAVLEAGESRPEWNRMGSTAVVTLLQDQTLCIANVGDSRAYLLRSGELYLLSHDHSVAAALAEQNYISYEEVRTHPLRNRLTVCLGIEPQIEPYTCQISLQIGDRLLLCSDGLWDMLPDQEITHLWSQHEDAEEAVRALVNAANLAGGQDNITVVALNINGRADISISPLEKHSVSTLDDTVVVAC